VRSVSNEYHPLFTHASSYSLVRFHIRASTATTHCTHPHNRKPTSSQPLLPNHLHSPTTPPLELNTRRQTRNGVARLTHYIRNDRVLPWWDLLGQIHVLRELRLLVLVEGALEVHFANCVAKVGRLADDGDEAVFDLQVDLGAGFDVFVEDS